MTKEAPLRSYGRVKGRALKPRQARLLETLAPRVEIPAQGPIHPDALFGGDDALPQQRRAPRTILEIGFGGGEHLAAQAAAHPDWRYLGVEPFLNGFASCLRHVEESRLSNVRIRQGDAHDVLARLAYSTLDCVYILFPDPWPKRRHWKRRLIQSEFIAELARVLKADGEVRFATDWRHYAAWTLELFLREQRLAWHAERADDWRKPWADHVATRYEQKGLGDSIPIFLRFSRKHAVF